MNGEEARLDGGSCVEEGAFDGVFGEFKGKCVEGLVQILPKRVYTDKVSVVGKRLDDFWMVKCEDSVQIAFGERGTDSVSGLFERFSFFRSARERPCGWFDLGTGHCSQIERYG